VPCRTTSAASWLARKTFGKGLVQSVRGLSDGSGIDGDDAKIHHPEAGADIHKHGISPDVSVKE